MTDRYHFRLATGSDWPALSALLAEQFPDPVPVLQQVSRRAAHSRIWLAERMDMLAGIALWQQREQDLDLWIWMDSSCTDSDAHDFLIERVVEEARRLNLRRLNLRTLQNRALQAPLAHCA